MEDKMKKKMFPNFLRKNRTSNERYGTYLKEWQCCMYFMPGTVRTPHHRGELSKQDTDTFTKEFALFIAGGDGCSFFNIPPTSVEAERYF